jgi:hypothetical protein
LLPFYSFAKTEIDYRNSEGINENDVLEDIYQTALCIVSRGTAGNGDFEELQKVLGASAILFFLKVITLKKQLPTLQRRLIFRH